MASISNRFDVQLVESWISLCESGFSTELLLVDSCFFWTRKADLGRRSHAVVWWYGDILIKTKDKAAA